MRTAPVSPAAIARIQRARAKGAFISFVDEALSGAERVIAVARLDTPVSAHAVREEIVIVRADGTARHQTRPGEAYDFLTTEQMDALGMREPDGSEDDGCSERAMELRNHDWTMERWSREEYLDACGYEF